MKNRLILFVIFFIVVKSILYAQEIHYSQYYSYPLYINPSLTGFTICKSRVGLNYKKQFASFTSPYATAGLWGDTKWKPRILNREDWFGIGGYIFNDESGSATLRHFRATLCFAYHRVMNVYRTVNFTIGVSGGYGMKSINYVGMLFGNQWNGLYFDNLIPSGEKFMYYKMSYFDLNIGALLSVKPSSFMNYYFGASLNHLNQPNNTFQDIDNPMGMKFNAHIGVNAVLSRKVIMEPQFYYITQIAASEWLLGNNFTVQFNNSGFLIGMFFRSPGDLIPSVGYIFNNARFVFTYDFNISQVAKMTKGRGGPEISMIFKFCPKESPHNASSGFQNYNKKGFMCPHF